MPTNPCSSSATSIRRPDADMAVSMADYGYSKPTTRLFSSLTGYDR